MSPLKNTLSSSRVHTASYSEHLAVSLIHFANTNASFASWFSSVIPPRSSFEKTTIPTTETPFTLKDEQQAVARGQWLMYMLEHTLLPQSKPALDLLQTWNNSREQTEPKAIILGLKWGVEPFGIWGEPKRKMHPMNIVIREDIVSSHTKSVLAQEVTTLSHTLVSNSVLKAHGNIQYLEPELSDWLFGEKYIHLFKTKQTAITELLRYVKEWNIPHTALTHDTQTTHIALNPIAYLEDMPCSSQCEKVTD